MGLVSNINGSEAGVRQQGVGGNERVGWSTSAPPSNLLSQCQIFHVSKRWWKFGFCVKSQFKVDKLIQILKVLCESTPELGSSLSSQSTILILETVGLCHF